MSREVFEVVRRILAARDDLELGVLFGSAARGTLTATSDVDLAILGRDADLPGISADIARELDREIQVVRLEDASIPLLESLIDDGRMVFENRRGKFALWRSRTLADLEIDRPWYARQRDAWLKRVAERGP